MRVRLLLPILLFACFSICIAQADERLTNFISDVTIESDGTLNVTETISIEVEGKQFRRGIFRDFPFSVQVVSVSRNDLAEPFVIENLNQGQRVRIGNTERLLEHGSQRYSLKYKTSGQIEFSPHHDSIVWNATGTWAFKIDNIEVKITLPKEAKIHEAAAGTSEGNPKLVSQSNNSIVWRTTAVLDPNKAFDISLRWAKGAVLSPVELLRNAFVTKFGVSEFVDEATLIANPFRFKGRVVALRTQFARMTAETEALFVLSEPMRVSGVPTARFTRPEFLVLALRIDGLKDGVVIGTFVGDHKCQFPLCADFHN